MSDADFSKAFSGIDEAKSGMAGVILPTGLLDDENNLHKDAILRELTGTEEDILMSSSLKATNKTQKILENCILQIGDIKQSDPKWSSYVKSLVGSDRLLLIIKIRMLSLGSFLSFGVDCPSCGKNDNQEVNLNEFKITGMKDPYARSWAGVLPRSKKTFKAKVQTGHDDSRAVKNKSEDSMTLMIIPRLLELDGKTPVEVADVKSLPMADRIYLRKELKNHEGEIEDTVDVVCSHCEHEFKADIDITSSGFFFPSEIRDV